MRVVLVGMLIACGSSSQPPGGSNAGTASESGGPPVTAVKAKTPGEFLRQPSSFVVGTTGDDISDRVIFGQADMVRAAFAPTAKVVPDTEAIKGWPANPSVYGGAHVNAAIAAIAKDLPFEVTANKLVIGGQTFVGDQYALVTVVPARAGKYPEMMLYAGTGTPGVAGINAGLTRSNTPIVVADAFGVLMTGTWIIGADGVATAQLGPPARRVQWRETKKTIQGVDVTFKLYEGTADRDTPMIAKAEQGITNALAKLAPGRTGRPVAFTVVIHPDRRSKAQLSGRDLDGHAVGYANTLHVFAYEGLDYLVTHEATHSILLLDWIPAGSTLLGEGIAVWTTGGYAGTPLGSFKGKLKPRSIKDLLSVKTFQSIPEPETYPVAGTLVEAAIAKVGLVKFRDHLYGATAETWDDACKAAGTTAADLDAAVANALY